MSRTGRRYDWALLLPGDLALPVDTVTVLGGDDQAARGVVDAGIARRWERAGRTRDADLAVVWADAADDIDAALRTVRARVIVVELDRTRRGQRTTTLAALERRLSRVGCRVVSAHIASPDLAAPRRLLPIDDGAPLRWHLRTLFIAATPVTTALRAALSVLSRTPAFRRLAGALAPRLLVVARGESGGRGTRAGIVGSPAGVPGDRAIVLTSGYDAGSRSIVLPFAAGDAAPRHVVKVATGPDSEEATAGEHERLRRLHRALPSGVARALPLPLRELSIGARAACVQTCATGPSLQTLAGAWGRRHSTKANDLRRVVDWYNGLARATLDRRHRHEWVDVFAAASAHLALDRPTLELLATAEAEAVRTGLAELAVHQHYDAGPWNINVDRGGIGVVDWELDQRRPGDCLGPPLADVLYLVMYWYFAVRRITTTAAEDEAMTLLFVRRMPSDSSVVTARRAVDAALSALSLDRSHVAPALVALWAERAVYTGRRRASLGTTPSEATRPMGHLAHLAAHSAELFTGHGWWAFPVGTEFANDHPTRPVRSQPAGD